MRQTHFLAANLVLCEALRVLPERWRVALWHSHIEGKTTAEIGARMNISANAVTSLLHRARAGFREQYFQQHSAAVPRSA